MSTTRIGFAMCGSFCTFSKAITQIKDLINMGYTITPIMSFNAYNTDTRFGKAHDHVKEIESITGEKIIHTVADAEPIGPKKMADVIVVAPCTGNTLAKITLGITDTPVTMAVKSQLRIERPIILALASNDALGISAQNLGKVLNYKNIYLVPLSQDNPAKKPNSLVAHFEMLPTVIESVMNGGKQIQPIFA